MYSYFSFGKHAYCNPRGFKVTSKFVLPPQRQLWMLVRRLELLLKKHTKLLMEPMNPG